MDNICADPLNVCVSAPVAILYATVSGNAEELARATEQAWRAQGRACVAANVADFPAARLRECDVAVVIASTWGDGAPPPEAEKFWAAVADPALDLAQLQYAVLALGSSAYPDFCAAGRRLDEQLAARGARRLVERVDCDTKFAADFKDWLRRVEWALDNPA